MTDRRLYPASSRVAHMSLGAMAGDLPLTAGEDMEISAPLADLLSAPQGARDRQLAYGERFCLIDKADGHGFGFALKDGYCGWLALAHLKSATPQRPKTHWVCALASHLYPTADLRAPPRHQLPFGAQLAVDGQENGFARTDQGYIPVPHLRARANAFADPVSVAEIFLGVPYLWGGNSAAGIDCSGLVQGALLACGIAAPADSDLQQSLGAQLPDNAALQRGDLLFWRGHVALVVDPQRLIHANGHSMSVTYENITDCAQRIALAGQGEIIRRARL